MQTQRPEKNSVFGRQSNACVKLTCVCYILTHTVRLVESQGGKAMSAVFWSLHLIPPQ